MKRCATGGIIRSSVATRYQLGLVRHDASVTSPLSALTPQGTCDWAMNSASGASTSAANEAANLALSRNKNPSWGGRIGGAGAPGAGFWINFATDSPLSAAKAAVLTSPTTFRALPASAVATPA